MKSQRCEAMARKKDERSARKKERKKECSKAMTTATSDDKSFKAGEETRYHYGSGNYPWRE